jgi:protein-S-isoprenylcysteine O-methyltransferase Ste14
VTGRVARNLAFAVGGLVTFLALVLSAWGNYETFFSHPARAGAVLLSIGGAIAYGFSGSSGFGTGLREDATSRWVFLPLLVVALGFACVPPYLDRRNIWSIDGDVARYLGLLLTAVGGYLRVATVFALGHRFSIFVVRQPNHELKTDGAYAVVRHPSYSGALLAMIGWSLVFRSLAGLLFIGLILIPVVIRVSAEEDFLTREFGDQYREYQRQTRCRLLPFVY